MPQAILPLLLALLALPALADVTGVVVGVSDGDTMTVLDDTKTQHKIRIQGIDAPEKGQPFGQKAKERMTDLVYGKEVRVEGDKRDRYGRTVAKVWVKPDECPLGLLQFGLATGNVPKAFSTRFRRHWGPFVEYVF